MSNVFERIAASVPTNKTAAMVTSGANNDGELTPAQKRENLISLMAKVQDAIYRSTDKEQKKRLGKRKQEIQTAISSLNLKRVRDPNFPDMFIECAREMLTTAMFRILRDDAYRRLDAERAKLRSQECEADADAAGDRFA